MNPIVALLVLWIVTAPLTYLVGRWDQMKTVGTWTRLDRLGLITLSILLGPYGLFGIGAAILISKISDTDWAKQDAKW